MKLCGGPQSGTRGEVNAKKLLPVLVLACGLLFAQSTPEPILKSAGQPTYPPLARAAHIEGEVRLEFVLNRAAIPRR